MTSQASETSGSSSSSMRMLGEPGPKGPLEEGLGFETSFRLSPEDFARFIETCENPPAPNDELKKLFREYAVWEASQAQREAQAAPSKIHFPDGAVEAAAQAIYHRRGGGDLGLANEMYWRAAKEDAKAALSAACRWMEENEPAAKAALKEGK